MKQDYISLILKLNRLTVMKNLAEAFKHYSEWYPHSALGYRSPWEYLQHLTHNEISNKKVSGNMEPNRIMVHKKSLSMKPWDPWIGMTVLIVIIFLMIHCTYDYVPSVMCHQLISFNLHSR